MIFNTFNSPRIQAVYGLWYFDSGNGPVNISKSCTTWILGLYFQIRIMSRFVYFFNKTTPKINLNNIIIRTGMQKTGFHVIRGKVIRRELLDVYVYWLIGDFRNHFPILFLVIIYPSQKLGIIIFYLQKCFSLKLYPQISNCEQLVLENIFCIFFSKFIQSKKIRTNLRAEIYNYVIQLKRKFHISKPQLYLSG